MRLSRKACAFFVGRFLFYEHGWGVLLNQVANYSCRFLRSSLSSSYASVKTPEKEAFEAMALTAQDARSKSLGSPLAKNSMRNTETTTKSVSGKDSQLEQLTSNSESNRPKQDKKAIVSAVTKVLV